MATDSRDTTDSTGSSGTVRVAVHDRDDLEATAEGIGADPDTLTKRERALLAREPNGPVARALADQELSARERQLLEAVPPPPDVEETTNTTVDGLNEYIVDNLHTDQSTNEDASHLAVGDDGASGTSTGDSSLNNEVGRFSVTDSIDQGKDLLLSTFLDSSEANGNTLDEVGVFTASSGGTLFNHSTISSVSKDNTKTLTIDVTLKFRSA